MIKKTIIGCCLTMIGAFSAVMIMICNGFHMNEMMGWSTPPGKTITSISQTGMTVPLVCSIIIFVVGLCVLIKEYFSK